MNRLFGVRKFNMVVYPMKSKHMFAQKVSTQSMKIQSVSIRPDEKVFEKFFICD